MAETKRSEWVARVARWKASGLTAAEFAAKDEVSLARLYSWSSRLKEEPQPPAQFVEVKLPATAAGYIAIVVREGVRVEVSGEFDPQVLRRVLSTLEVRP